MVGEQHHQDSQEFILKFFEWLVKSGGLDLDLSLTTNGQNYICTSRAFFKKINSIIHSDVNSAGRNKATGPTPSGQSLRFSEGGLKGYYQKKVRIKIFMIDSL